MTILYNSTTEKFISDYLPNGYLVDGKHQVVSPPYYELTIVDTVAPSYNSATQKISSVRSIDLVNKEWKQNWIVTNKTYAELIEEIELLAVQADNAVSDIASSRILSEMVGTIRSEAFVLTDSEALSSIDLFPPYRVDIPYITGERFYYPINGFLYKVLQNHTSQLDWTPPTAVSLYVKVTPPDVIAPWVQPLGAQDAYAIGVKVTYGGFTWQNNTANNVWQPGVYGWTKI